MKPRLLDLFCGAGGAAMGYSRAGFEVVGVDSAPQKRYPFEFHQADALEFCAAHGRAFDAIHASPPCQGYSIMRNLPWNRDRQYPLLIAPTRTVLAASGKQWVIENVDGARNYMRAGYLCGTMFGLPLYRHRRFESTFLWLGPSHEPHRYTILGGRSLAGRAREMVFTAPRYNRTQPFHRPGFDRDGSAGHGNAARTRALLGVPWMTAAEASQAIPPAYTEFIGTQLLRAVTRRDQHAGS